jgi:hypothetical protein
MKSTIEGVLAAVLQRQLRVFKTAGQLQKSEPVLNSDFFNDLVLLRRHAFHRARG